MRVECRVENMATSGATAFACRQHTLTAISCLGEVCLTGFTIRATTLSAPTHSGHVYSFEDIARCERATRSPKASDATSDTAAARRWPTSCVSAGAEARLPSSVRIVTVDTVLVHQRHHGSRTLTRAQTACEELVVFSKRSKCFLRT